MKRMPQVIIIDFITYIIAIIIVLLAVIPVLWIFITAFKTKGDIFSLPPAWFFSPTFNNFIDIFRNRDFSHFLINSTIVSLSTTALALLIGIPAAYAFSRYHFKRKKDLIFWILSIRMAPPISAVIPLFIIISRLGLIDTHIALIWVYLLINLPFVVWIMKGFFDEIPFDLDEAARLDGCSEVGTMIRIILPLTSPGMVATSILCLIFSWNEFLFALILTGINARTLPVTITQFLTLTGVAWGPMCAAGTITIIPIFVFTLLSQKHLIRGLTLGAIKQ